jgi:hypothetical protein
VKQAFTAAGGPQKIIVDVAPGVPLGNGSPNRTQ